jgi:hypothetical protein
MKKPGPHAVRDPIIMSCHVPRPVKAALAGQSKLGLNPEGTARAPRFRCSRFRCSRFRCWAWRNSGVGHGEILTRLHGS